MPRTTLSLSPVLLLSALLAGCGGADARIAALERRVAELESRAPATSLVATSETKAPTTSAPPVEPFAPAEPGWLMSGGGRSVYAVTLDPQVPRNGHPSVGLAPIAETNAKYGTWMRELDATPYRGKRVRVSGFIATEGTSQRADLWARIQARTSPPDGRGLAGGNVALPAKSSWQEHEIVFDVPQDGDRVEYGVGIAGPGRLWVDELKLDVVEAAPSPGSRQL